MSTISETVKVKIVIYQVKEAWPQTPILSSLLELQLITKLCHCQWMIYGASVGKCTQNTESLL